MGRLNRIVPAIIIGACLSVPVGAQTAKLPIAEGVWVKTDTKCETAYIAQVYGAKRFGTFYFYGPKQSMGPANETEALTRASKTKDGFVMVNEGPLEVASRPNGKAVVRANSPSQGVQWTEQVRLCPPANLSRKMRDALTKSGLVKAAAR
ncbi:hypothetical protein [Sphingorhabdus sp.]|uniref:hypothetical protein n=1 Tax=Sphingorhabdus sp. TaxID=1902408 RepID=UPI0035944A2F